jgi:tyrosyl-tRNA synthetase
MIAKESVRARLEDRAHGISFTEFSYMLLQAYDFWYLHETHQCRLQIGGSDQWGNITAGTELIRRKKAGEESSEAFGLTHPLVTKADGTKFGKTESGTVWLSPEKTSPYQLYQFFIQTDDVDVFTYLRYFTFLSQEEILSIEQEHSRSPEQRRAQKRLAQEVLRLTYGEDTLSECESSAQALFSGNLLALPLNALLQAFEQTPSITVPRGEIVQGLPLLDALVRVGLCTSKGAARKEVQGGGININQVRVNDPQRTLQEADLLHGSMIVIRKGKKTYALLKVEN